MAAQQLSHDEVWDDSALVDSWNEALAEYKKYHSIAAKGERVEDVLAAAEHAETSAPVETLTSDVHAGLPAWEPKDTKMEDQPHIADDVPKTTISKPLPAVEQQSATNPPPIGAPLSAMPQAIMTTVQDEGLKNLMMSWYYAGYYTGLYEGQAKAHSAQPGSNTHTEAG